MTDTPSDEPRRDESAAKSVPPGAAPKPGRELEFDEDGNIVGIAFTSEVDYFIEFPPTTTPHHPVSGS